MIGEWEAIPEEPEYDMEFFYVEPGRPFPLWAFNALVRGELKIEPEPEIGDEDWGRDIRVVKTGCLFTVGSRMSKGDLNFPPI